MLMIAGLMSLLFAGVVVDAGITAFGARQDDDDDDLPDRTLSDPGNGEGVEDPQGESLDGMQTGTDFFDALIGRDGNDLLDGRGGADDLRGGQGDDTLQGGTGDDCLQGESDHGPGGDDLLDGGAGDDSLAGQGGDDRADGGSGSDTIQGGMGDDHLSGGAGTDWLDGNCGNDSLIAGAGEDDLSGGDGVDLLIGNDGGETSWLHGGAGDDTLIAGAGDFAEGQQGDDLYIVHPGTGPVPVITGIDGKADEIALQLPQHLMPGAVVDLARDGDGSLLLRVNGAAVARLVGAVHSDQLQVLVGLEPG